MRHRFNVAIGCWLTLGFAGATSAASPQGAGELRGVVVDEDGVAVADELVESAGDARGPQTTSDLPTKGSHDAVRVVRASRVTTEPAINGRLDDTCWAAIEPVSDFRQRNPDEGMPATERTEIRVGYDETSLYIGVRLFDRQPGRIVRRLTRRDSSANSDSLTVYLDSFLDHRTGVMFQVSAAGVQRDALVYDDDRIDDTWDAVWYSAVGQDEGGWTVELRIPLSQLRFGTLANQTWGIQVVRYLQRRAEDAWLELVPRDANWLASRMAHLTGLDGIRSGSHLELLPYVTSRASFIAPKPGDPFNDGSTYLASAGLDLKWGVTGGITLDATVRPDFGQVEVDPSVVNLSEFETFYDEKRPFFLEGSQIFRPMAGNALFYSRRIGRAPQGRAGGEFAEGIDATTVLGATKLTGQTDSGWSFGLLDAVTSREIAATETDGTGASAEVEPFTNYLVGRVRRDGQFGGFGSMVTATNRQLQTTELRNALARQAYVTSGDGYLYLDPRRDWVLSGQVATSRFDGAPSAILVQQRSSRRYYQRPDAEHVALDPTATSLSGWSSRLRLKRNSGIWQIDATASATSPGFEMNDLGFQQRADRVGASATLTWRHSTPNRWTRDRSLWVSKSNQWNFGHQEQQDRWSAGGSTTFLNYWYVSGSMSVDHGTLDDHLTQGGPLAASPAGRRADLALGSDSRKPFSFWIGPGYSSDEAGGLGAYLSSSITFRSSSRFAVSAGPSFSRYRTAALLIAVVPDPLATNTFGRRYVFADIDQRSTSFTTRLNLTLAPRLSAQLYAEPFIGTGQYGSFKEFLRPGTFTFAEYGSQQGAITPAEGGAGYVIDPDRAGPATSFTVGNFDFNAKSLTVKTVLRWEWRQGSTLYFAWTQQRHHDSRPQEPRFGRDVRLMFSAPADDVFMIKASYWFGQ